MPQKLHGDFPFPLEPFKLISTLPKKGSILKIMFSIDKKNISSMDVPCMHYENNEKVNENVYKDSYVYSRCYSEKMSFFYMHLTEPCVPNSNEKKEVSDYKEIMILTAFQPQFVFKI
jgi:hypothetical protein